MLVVPFIMFIGVKLPGAWAYGVKPEHPGCNDQGIWQSKKTPQLPECLHPYPLLAQ